MVAQLAALKASHGAQMAAARAEAEVRRPRGLKPSAQYISQRRVEEVLVKQVCFGGGVEGKGRWTV
mgnify:CR=1 FL=1